MKISAILYISTVLLCLALGACRPKLSQEEECSRNIQAAERLLEQYFDNGNLIGLDSAMLYLNEVDCDKYTAVTAMYKARVYYAKANFPDAIKAVSSIPDSLLDFPTLKLILIGELEAKWAKADNDTERERNVYERQDIALRDTITKKWLLYTPALKAITTSVRVDNSEAALVVGQYFYNKSKFFDQSNVLSQIDSMHGIVNGGDPFFEELRHIIVDDQDYVVNYEFF